jgi:hypothetical protein
MLASLWTRSRRTAGVLLALTALAGFTIALGTAGARPSASRPSWTGTWECGGHIGTMVLTQAGNRVTGTYTGWGPLPPGVTGDTGYDGRISGSLTYPSATPLGYFAGTWSDVGEAKEHAGTLTMQMIVFGGQYVIGGIHSREGAFGLCKAGRAATTTTATSGSTTTAPPPATTAPTSTRESADWPTVHAYPVKSPWPLRPDTYAWLPYSVEDASGKAKVHGTLYQDGVAVLQGESKYFIAADGRRWYWKARLAPTLTGPLRWCVWAENPKGNESVLAPRSSCAWLSLLVDIKRVSNGCGGEGWKTLVWVENYFGNEHTYKNSNRNPLAASYTVDFKDACDLHDAGYAGVTVRDTVSNRIVDFRTWSRKQVDDKFWRDMKKICGTIPADATVARSKCTGVGGPASIGSRWLYNKVRYWGNRFFDADLTRPGLQRTGHRDNS